MHIDKYIFLNVIKDMSTLNNVRAPRSQKFHEIMKIVNITRESLVDGKAKAMTTLYIMILPTIDIVAIKK